MVKTTPRPLNPQERDPIPKYRRLAEPPGPVWTRAENVAPTGIRSLDRSARSDSLYRPRHPKPRLIFHKNIKIYDGTGKIVYDCDRILFLNETTFQFYDIPFRSS